MSITTWLDAIQDVWATVSDGSGGQVKAPYVFKRDEFPEAINPDEFPIALSYPTGVEQQYSSGGPCIEYWTGQTEFHISPNVNKHNLAAVLRYFDRIRDAAAGNMLLSGAVNGHFMLRVDTQNILGPLTLQYGGEEPHHGLMVYWQVKDNVSGEFTVGDPTV